MLTATERRISMLLGLSIGLTAVAFMVWSARPVAKPPSIGANVSLSVLIADGVTGVAGDRDLRFRDLMPGGIPKRASFKVKVSSAASGNLGFRLEPGTEAEVSSNPAASLVRIQLGKRGEYGAGPISSFAGPPRRLKRFHAVGSKSVPVSVWIPEFAGYEAAGVDLDVRLVPVLETRS